MLEDFANLGSCFGRIYFRSVWYEIGLSIVAGSNTSLASGFPQLALRPLIQFCLSTCRQFSDVSSSCLPPIWQLLSGTVAALMGSELMGLSYQMRVRRRFSSGPTEMDGFRKLKRIVRIQRYSRLRLINSYPNQVSEAKKNLKCDLGAPWP